MLARYLSLIFLNQMAIDICILILVFNAAVCCHTIPPLFPQHVFRHYTYLRDTLPDLIPAIRVSIIFHCCLYVVKKYPVAMNF